MLVTCLCLFDHLHEAVSFCRPYQPRFYVLSKKQECQPKREGEYLRKLNWWIRLRYLFQILNYEKMATKKFRIEIYLVGEGDLVLMEGDLADIERDSLAGGSGEKDILFFEEFFEDGIRRGLNV